MLRLIQLTRTTSSRTTSQVTRPDDTKAIGTCLQALFPCLRLASLILAGRIAIPLLLLSVGMVVVQPCAGQGGTWITTGSVNFRRPGHTEMLLTTGEVLVEGGSGDGLFASAELYNPASGTWAEIGSLTEGREGGQTATLLPNGKVLVAGGWNFNPFVSLRSAELYEASQRRHDDNHSARLFRRPPSV